MCVFFYLLGFNFFRNINKIWLCRRWCNRKLAQNIYIYFFSFNVLSMLIGSRLNWENILCGKETANGLLFTLFRESPHITCLWAVATVKMADEVSVHQMLAVALYLMYYYCCHRHRRYQLSEQFHLYDVRALLVLFLSLNPVPNHTKKTGFESNCYYIEIRSNCFDFLPNYIYTTK